MKTVLFVLPPVAAPLETLQMHVADGKGRPSAGGSRRPCLVEDSSLVNGWRGRKVSACRPCLVEGSSLASGWRGCKGSVGGSCRPCWVKDWFLGGCRYRISWLHLAKGKYSLRSSGLCR